MTALIVTDDQEWVSQCLGNLAAEGQDASYENVEAAYLDSDLAQTTLQGVIPQELNDGVLFPRPTLVQLHSITEIGASAFALNTAREQRREVLSGATRIRGIDDDEDDIDDSKLPAYPRSMLGFEVSDGRSTIRAFEYRRLPELQLGETRLGLKVSSAELHSNGPTDNSFSYTTSRSCAAGCSSSRRTAPSSADASTSLRTVSHRLSSRASRSVYSKLQTLYLKLTSSDAKENPVRMTQPGRGRGRRTLPASTASTRARATRPATARGPSATARAPVSAANSAEARAARAAAIRAAMENPDPPEERARPAPETQVTGATSSAPAGPSSGSFANPTVISDDEDEFGDIDDSFIRAMDEVEAAGAGVVASSSRTRTQPTQRSSGRSVIPADAEIIELSDSD